MYAYTYIYIYIHMYIYIYIYIHISLRSKSPTNRGVVKSKTPEGVSTGVDPFTLSVCFYWFEQMFIVFHVFLQIYIPPRDLSPPFVGLLRRERSGAFVVMACGKAVGRSCALQMARVVSCRGRVASVRFPCSKRSGNNSFTASGKEGP